MALLEYRHPVPACVAPPPGQDEFAWTRNLSDGLRRALNKIALRLGGAAAVSPYGPELDRNYGFTHASPCPEKMMPFCTSIHVTLRFLFPTGEFKNGLWYWNESTHDLARRR